ncbi:MAG: hypothetical protein ACK58L_19600 [Planctomycetota bacterium]
MAEIITHPESATSQQPAGQRPAAASGDRLSVAGQAYAGLESVAIPEIRTQSTEESEDGSEIPSVVAAALSTTAVSFYTSLAFHLLTWGFVAIVAGWLGLEWIIPSNDTTPPLMASLGEEDFQDELPLLDLTGDEAIVMEAPASTIEQIAEQLQKSDSGWLRSTEDVALKSVVGSDAIDPDADGAGRLLKVPKSGLAVTKGSFTAFTIPANPKPGETYSIVIEVRLPDDVKKFRVADLTGEVKGSDKYSQKIPYDTRTPNASGYPTANERIVRLDASTVLDVIDNKVQIVIKVPGAARLVKDTIKIRSRKLKEEQELTLIFGAPGKRQDPDETNE